MNLKALKSYFRETGFQPKHRLGQNFLIDANLATKLVDSAEVKNSDSVVEIGPGMGMISAKILETGSELHAIEQDTLLVDFLQRQFQERSDRFHLIHGDAVKIPLAGQLETKNLKVIANPPFAITGPWLSAVLELGFPETFALILQREAVERITAKPGRKLFGVLALQIAFAYGISSTHPISSQSFYPEPKIESDMLVLRRVDEPLRFDPGFLVMAQLFFRQRRKQIGGILKKSPHVDFFPILEKADLDPTLRAEQIPLDQWRELHFHYVEMNQIPSKR